MNAGEIQQVGTPTEIYDNPANTFVASFIGSPAMNLIDGTLMGGTFKGEGITVTGLAGRDGPVTLGFRAEDAEIVPADGQIAAPVYAVELLGEASMITWRLGDALVSIKTAKDYRADTGQMVEGSVPAAICHLFDADTGKVIPR